MWTIQFWRDLLERAIKSGAQAAALAYGGNLVDVWSLDWKAVVGVILAGAFLSVLTSLGSNVVVNNGTASVTRAVEPAPVTVTEPPLLY